MQAADFIRFFGSYDALIDELLQYKEGELEIYNYKNFSFYCANREICFWDNNLDTSAEYIFLDCYNNNWVFAR